MQGLKPICLSNMYARYVPPSKVSSSSTDQLSTPQPRQQQSPGSYSRYVPPAEKTTSKPHRFFDDENDEDGANAAFEEPPAKKVKITFGEEDAPATATPQQLSLSPAALSEKRGKSVNDESAQQNSVGESRESPDKQNKPKKSKKHKRDKKVKTEDGEVLSTHGEDEPASESQPVVAQPRPEVKADDALPDMKATKEKSKKRKPDQATPTAKGVKEKRKKRKSTSELHNDQNEPDGEEEETHTRHKSMFKKKEKSLKAPESAMAAVDDQPTEHQDILMDDTPVADEVHGLEPLPQPAPVIQEFAKIQYETLPSWLAEPIRVSRHATASFGSFGISAGYGISAEVAGSLSTKGYKEAFAIQTAVIPELLPHHDRFHQGDLLVSAATGSGKTLAYVLPMIRDLSQGDRLTRPRALIVLPTRELVRQAQQVCEEVAGIFALEGHRKRVKVAISMGSQPLQKEQAVLISKTEPRNFEIDQGASQGIPSKGLKEDDEEDANDTEDEERREVHKRETHRASSMHASQYKSNWDVLICTPGRLVEHIKLTPGFSLDHIRWLIVDEADKLLGQHFQQWLDVVMPRLHDDERLDFRRQHEQSNLSGVRKVILSATMTRDLDLLDGLKLRRPKLIILEGSEEASDTKESGETAKLALPEFLEESALKVDADLKPLFLLDLLQNERVMNLGEEAAQGKTDSSSSSSAESDSESDSNDSDSDSDSEIDTSSSDSDSDVDEEQTQTTKARTGTKSNVLIFTRSNEAALRLSRLLALMSPGLASVLGTMTQNTPSSTRKKTLNAFAAGKVRVIVASDLVSRGLDLPSLQHVINYDMPSSIESYVHRVGRTARANESGHAWTLFTDSEAHWFWKQVANQQVIKRSKKVERLRITEEKEAAFEEKKARFEQALGKLGDEARETRKRARR